MTHFTIDTTTNIIAPATAAEAKALAGTERFSGEAATGEAGSQLAGRLAGRPLPLTVLGNTLDKPVLLARDKVYCNVFKKICRGLVTPW